jgi:hypothetical protein
MPGGVCPSASLYFSPVVFPRLRSGMICLADRNFFGLELWQMAQATGADLLWRMKKNMRMACEKRLSDRATQAPTPNRHPKGHQDS